MCLLIKQPKNAPIDWQLMRHAYMTNRDGMGVAFPVGEGKVHVHKILPKSWAECEHVLKMYESQLKHVDMAVHFRLTTAGKTTREMAHPFQLLRWREDGRDAWLFHNGTMYGLPDVDPNKSDTWHLAEVVLKPILKARPDLVGDSGLHKMVENIMDGDRGLLVDGKTGNLVVLNRSKWHTVANGVMLSNTYGYSGYDPVKQEVKISTYYGGNGTGSSRKGGAIDSRKVGDYWDKYYASAWGYDEDEDGIPIVGGRDVVEKGTAGKLLSLEDWRKKDEDEEADVEAILEMEADEIMEAICQDPTGFLKLLDIAVG